MSIQTDTLDSGESSSARRPDNEIREEAIAMLRRELPEVADRLSVLVEQGELILRGEVEWYHQRDRAQAIALVVKGIRCVVNELKVWPKVDKAEIARHIGAALHRSAEIDTRRICISVEGHKVTLTGHVRSWAERQLAEEAALAIAGVTEVKNLIDVAF